MNFQEVSEGNLRFNTYCLFYDFVVAYVALSQKVCMLVMVGEEIFIRIG